MHAELQQTWLELGSRSLGVIGIAALGEGLRQQLGTSQAIASPANTLGAVQDAAAPSAAVAAGVGVAASAGTGVKLKLLALAAAMLLAIDVASTSQVGPGSAQASGTNNTPATTDAEEIGPSAGPLLHIPQGGLPTSIRPERAAPEDGQHSSAGDRSPGLQAFPLHPDDSPGENPITTDDEATLTHPDRDPSEGRYSGDDWVPYLDIDSDQGRPLPPAPVPPAVVDPEDVIRPSVEVPTDPDSESGYVPEDVPEDVPVEESPDNADTPGGNGTDKNEEETPSPESPPKPAVEKPTIAGSNSNLEYLFPVLTGTASSAGRVLVELQDETRIGTEVRGSTDGTVYEVMADTQGAWSFDSAGIAPIEGTYTAVVWEVKDGTASAAATRTFDLLGPGLTLMPWSRLSSLDAELDGLAVDFDGPAGGTQCVVTSTHQVFDIPYDDSGRARRFIRFAGEGTFSLRFANCAADRFGPPSKPK